MNADQCRRLRRPALALCLLAAAAAWGPAGAAQFSDEERAKVVAYWNEPWRYQAGLPPEAAQRGPWQVRLTPDGSRWFLAYQRAVGAAGAPPTMDARGATPETAAWEAWVQAKLSWDLWHAQATADAANLQVLPLALGPARGVLPPAPGLIPAGLLAAVGNPPAFAAAVTPLRHTITFDDGEVFNYTDNVSLRPRYAYYRFPQGTVAYGPQLRDMSDEELGALFSDAGMNPSEQRIARAVSRLEGGFETINTYDTGYVSIGFIQFVTLDSGRESLSEVLAREKADRPEAFQQDFRRFGLDVTPAGEIVAVDPATGAELVGPKAVPRLVEDKRFAAVFQRAGRHSRAFRIAQIQVARAHYWPADDRVTVTVNGRQVAGKVSDVIHSEAGMATLFDRKVNRGRIDPFASVLAKVMTDHNLATFAEAAAYEREIVAALQYRVDFLADRTLSQPPVAAP